MPTANINIKNQKPARVYQPNVLLPQIDPTLDPSLYIEKQVEHLKNLMVDPLFTPLNQSNPVVMEDVSDPKNPVQFNDDAVTSAIWNAWTTNTIDPDLEEQMNELYRQSLQFSQTNDWLIEHQMGQEAISIMNTQIKGQWPLPQNTPNGPFVQYTAQNDLIPQAKALLANFGDDEKTSWFAGMAGFLKPKQMDNFVLVTVQSHVDFDQMVADVVAYKNANTSSLTTNVNTLIGNLSKLSISGELSAGLFLPTPHAAETNSFTRILLNQIAENEKTNPDTWCVQPINSRQLVAPENLIILNLEEYAHATAKQINEDWTNLQKAFMLQKKLNLVSTKKLMTSKSVNASASGGSGYQRKKPGVSRRAQVMFTSKPITSDRVIHLMSKIISRAVSQKKTETEYKTQTKSYMRPNRRDPNNPNLKGKLSKVSYRPDVHIYIDTSGSISESQYRDTVGALIKLVKKMNTNLYITTFSHYITGTTLLRTKGLSNQEVYKNFLKIPKASGGTDFENVWRKIDQVNALNVNKGKSFQINFVITDFEYGLQRDRRFENGQASYKYTYYVPISTNQSGWDYITKSATRFMKEMQKAGAKNIRKHLIM